MKSYIFSVPAPVDLNSMVEEISGVGMVIKVDLDKRTLVCSIDAMDEYDLAIAIRDLGDELGIEIQRPAPIKEKS